MMLLMMFAFVTVMVPTSNAATFGDFQYQLIDSGNAVKITGYTGAGGSISIPASIDGKPVTTLGAYSFANDDVTVVVIPDNVTVIGDHAFDTCTDLVTVTIGNGVISIGNYSFSDCDILSTVNMGTNVVSIGMGAFQYNYALVSINLSSVVTIGDYAFLSCDSLTNVVLGEGLTSIGHGAFYDCVLLQSIVIPDSVTTIGIQAFNSCESLVSVTIGNGVQTIGIYAFYYCTSLTTVIIGENVTSIGNYTFMGCSSLDNITFLGDAPAVGVDWIKFTSANLVIYYLDGASGFTNPWEGVQTQVLQSIGGNGDNSEDVPADNGWVAIVFGVVLVSFIAIILARRGGYF